MNTHYIPQIWTRGGSCLTFQNWKEAGIEAIAYSLESLLFKPGIDFLRASKGMKSWSGWNGIIVLNARLPAGKNDNAFVLRSPWDGRLLHVSLQMVSELINHLAPDFVVLPEALLEKKLSIPISPFIESDTPAEDGFQGIAYSNSGILDLKDEQFVLQNFLIDDNCKCKTCQQSFTRSYLHHLYQHTPLLAQRFIIMHNVHSHHIKTLK